MLVKCPYCGYMNTFRKIREKTLVKGWVINPIYTKVCKSCNKYFRFSIKGGEVEIISPKKTSPDLS